LFLVIYILLARADICITLVVNSIFCNFLEYFILYFW